MKSSRSKIPQSKTEPPGIWVAVDLGSNSFHMLMAQPAGASFVMRDRLKEKVQLLAGFEDGQISEAAIDRGLACLSRFAQRLQGVPRERIVVMGTCALRQAGNAQAFIHAAQAILGAPVQVISGEYEAQLIYGGVAHQVGVQRSPRLAIDIGGGSTEFAVGIGSDADHAVSVNVGCVAFKERFFNDPLLRADSYRAARAEASRVLQQHFNGSGRDAVFTAGPGVSVFGTSGTVESIKTVLVANGWSSGNITREAMQRLETTIMEDRWAIDAGLPGLAPDRTDIFPAGVAILNACLEVLGAEQCEYVDVSLLQGIVCEKAVTESRMDLREDSVRQLARRFATDSDQARRVVNCVDTLYAQVKAWCGDDEYSDLLRWAAELHELGVHISARHYHRHGAYIVKHAEMPGFNEHQQRVLALLIRGHRRSMPGLSFRAFDPELAQKLLRLVALLRLAVIFERSHNDADSPAVTLDGAENELTVDCGPGWLAEHPLSYRELRVEQQQQATAGIQMKLLNTPD